MPGATTARAPWALLAAFGACLFYACIDQGATGPAAQSWLVLALAVVATAGVTGWLYGNGLQLRLAPAGIAGIALLVGFAVWCALSITWSVAPDRSWAEANTVIGFALAAVIGALIGSSLPRAYERLGLAIALVTVPVALYALGGKTLPGLFDHAEALNRLSAPFGYWNALALACVFGLLPLLRRAGDPSVRTASRVASLLGVFLFALVLGMTYSRGGVLALVAGVATLIVLSTERMRMVVMLVSAIVAAVVPLTVALGSAALTTDNVPVAERTDDAARLLVVTLVAAGLLALWGRAVIALESDWRFGPDRGRAIGRPLAFAAAGALALAAVAFTVTGATARAVDGFTDVTRAAGVTDPGRLLSASSGNRWVWWREAAGAWSDRPAAGWGAGSFTVTHRLYRKEPLSVEQPHNVPLQWLAENGLVGLLLAAGAIGALLAAGLSRVRSLPWAFADAPPERGAAAALLAIAVAWVVQCFVEWSWDIPAVTLPMFVALGALAARPGPAAARPFAARGPAVAATAAGFVLIALSALLPALAATRTNAAVGTAAEVGATPGDLADAAADADFAARVNPLSTDGLIAAATIAVRRDRPEAARDYLLRAVRRQPYDARSWAQLAAVELERGDIDSVLRATGRALALDPRSPFTVRLALDAVTTALAPSQSATATGAPLPTDVPALPEATAPPLPTPTAAPTTTAAPTAAPAP